jgi:hypothetical protein
LYIFPDVIFGEVLKFELLNTFTKRIRERTVLPYHPQLEVSGAVVSKGTIPTAEAVPKPEEDRSDEKNGTADDIVPVASDSSNEAPNAARVELPPGNSRGVNEIRAHEPDEEREKRSTRPSPSRHNASPERIRFRSDTRLSEMEPLRPKSHSRIFEMAGVGARQDLMNDPHVPSDIPRPYVQAAPIDSVRYGQETCRYFASHGWIGRNSQFAGLSLSEREKLGVVEYRTLTHFSWIVSTHFVLWQLFGAIAVGAWIAINRPEGTRSNGLNPW